jgi:hypothetical protein
VSNTQPEQNGPRPTAMPMMLPMKPKIVPKARSPNYRVG